MNDRAEMPDSLPTREDINVYDSLDERVAVDRFLGKDLDEAEAMFAENFLRYQECLMWMGPRAFRYYMPAAIKFVTTKANFVDMMFFLSVVDHWLTFQKEDVIPLAHSISDACRHIAQWVESPANESHYVHDLPEKLEKVRLGLGNMTTD